MNNRFIAYLFSSLTAAFAFSILSPEAESWRPITAGFVLCTAIIMLIVANED